MYRIAICEDEKVFMDENEKICRGIMEKLDAEFTLSLFDNSAAFLKSFFGQNMRYDLLLLDIVLGETNGMELAQKIRAHDNRAVIVFITSKPEYAVQGYNVKALHYLIKPINPDALERLIAADYHRRFCQSCLVFKSGVQNIRIPVADVVYLEIKGRRVSIIQKDGTVAEYNGKLSEFLTGLKQFVRCHNSYAVNVGNIRELTKTDAIAVNGAKIPVSRTYFKDLQKAFMRRMRDD